MECDISNVLSAYTTIRISVSPVLLGLLSSSWDFEYKNNPDSSVTSVLAVCNLIAVKFLLLGLIIDLAKEKSNSSDLNIIVASAESSKTCATDEQSGWENAAFFFCISDWHQESDGRVSVTLKVTTAATLCSWSPVLIPVWVGLAGDQLK